MTPPSGAPLRILNADDYGPARYARSKLLRQAGFEVLEAETGEETLRQAIASRPHVILLDVKLPDIDGYEVCRRLKTHAVTATIPVLHTSAAHREARDHARGLEAGAEGFLVEPVAPEVLLATVRSVARARLAEEEVRATARQWQLTFDAITDGVCLLDRDGALLRHNAIFARLTGNDQLLDGRDGVAIVGWVLRRPAGEVRALLAPERRAAREYLVGSRWLQLVCEAVKDESGWLEGTLIILTDISERKRADTMKSELLRLEQQARLAAEAANRAKDEFLAVLSHELRTPLTAMLGWIRLMANGQLDATTTTHAVEVIERNTRLQAQIVEDLLDVSRIISGKMRLELRDVDPAVLLRGAADAFRGEAAARGLGLEVAVEASLEPVRVDSGRLQQVFSNLLSNALKFTPAGGRVQVSADRHEGGLRVAVSDTGRGIEPDLLPFIFEPFRQAESAGRRTHTGLGLGLAIVRHLVELHGGRVAATSPGPGQGATFTVWLPADPPAVEGIDGDLDVPVELPEISRISLDGARLLVVEDDSDTREMVGLMLGESGADVVSVDSVAAALDALQSMTPDVLISDIGLADRDGLDLIRAVRQMPGGRGELPAIALSAFARESDRLAALRAGYDRHVSKPVEPSALRSAIAELRDRRRAS
ncbi:MAG TPA: response regulator [Methylomirabilota bacterium]|jgi:signal transduction histidine kinase|nr:response regulator [Methylomirabilota bacterium]